MVGLELDVGEARAVLVKGGEWDMSAPGGTCDRERVFREWMQVL